MNDDESAAFRLFPQAASTLAADVDRVYAYTLGLSVFFSVLVAALVVVFCVRFRHGRHGEIVEPRPAYARSHLEYAWIGALTLVFLSMFGWAAVVFARIRDVPQDAMQIRVLAKQWMWKFQYENGRRTIDELVAPLGRPVKLLMTSQDVIHSLFVPAFRVKQDVLPFRYTTLWFEATRTGRFHLFCAEYCGTDHSRMIGWVTVISQPEFEHWLEQVPPQNEQPEASGEELFSQFGCATCHVSGRGLAPTLSGLFGSTVLLDDGTSVVADESYIRESLLDPNAKIVAGFNPIMPSFHTSLTEAQVDALIAYIEGMRGLQP
jgi:cytochrome c oxidase subunit 2